MNKKVFVKLIALLMAAAMLLGVCACSATDNNPTIGKIGKVKIKLSQYQQIYQQYSYYAKSMDDFNGFIKNQLITYGVTLNKCYELGLDKEISQDELQKNVDAKLDQAIASYKVDASITDEAAIRENKLEQFKAALKKQGTSYKAYMKSLKQSELESMMMEMLQEKIYSEVQFDASAFEKYISENTLSQRDNYGKDVSAFMTAYNSYISGSGMIPLYTPNDMFTVKHLLVQYDNSDKVSDTVEGVFTDEQNKKLDEIRKALESGISLDEFVDKYVTDGDYQSDTVFVSATPDPSAISQLTKTKSLSPAIALKHRRFGFAQSAIGHQNFYRPFAEKGLEFKLCPHYAVGQLRKVRYGNNGKGFFCFCAGKPRYYPHTKSAQPVNGKQRYNNSQNFLGHKKTSCKCL